MRRLGARAARYGLTGWLLWRLLGPEVPPRYRGDQERPLRVPGRSVFVGQREFFVREVGPVDGPPLVLLHGWNFDGEATFYRIVPELATHFRVFVPDLRNHGKSDLIRGRFEIEDLAADVAAVLAALDVGPATVFGYSLGGMVAQALAHRHPGVVAALVLGSTSAHPIARYRILVRGAYWIGRALGRISPTEAARFTFEFLKRVGAVRPEHERWLYEELMDRDVTLYYEMGAAVWRFDARPWIGRVGVPALVIVTGADQLVEPAGQRELADAIEGATLLELPGGHESILTAPEAYVRAIRDFAGTG